MQSSRQILWACIPSLMLPFKMKISVILEKATHTHTHTYFMSEITMLAWVVEKNACSACVFSKAPLTLRSLAYLLRDLCKPNKMFSNKPIIM